VRGWHAGARSGLPRRRDRSPDVRDEQPDADRAADAAGFEEQRSHARIRYAGDEAGLHHRKSGVREHQVDHGGAAAPERSFREARHDVVRGAEDPDVDEAPAVREHGGIEDRPQREHCATPNQTGP
jgi:hypothetical protein